MGLFSWLFGGGFGAKMEKASKLEKRATAAKKDDPDKAIALLREAQDVRDEINMPGENDLRIATVLYEAGRFDEAEALLLGMYREARKWVIGKREFDAANAKYQERIRDAKRMDGGLQEWETRREGDENPDFARNLHCKRIYGKLRICYERSKRFDLALPFAMAEAYAKYENRTHDMYADDPKPDFKAVLRCLKRAGRETEMQRMELIFEKYAQKPDSTKCWQMIDELQEMPGQ